MTALALALLVHALLFGLMGLSLDFTKPIKPSMAPIQAVAIFEPLPVIEPEPEPEPVKAEPEPEPEPEPLPEPPKPVVKSTFPYTCAGKTLQTDDAEKAKALQADCEEQERKKKEAAEKKRQEKLLAEKKRKQEQKEKAEKKKQDELKKKAEAKKKADAKKKAEAQKKADAKKKAEAKKKADAKKKAEAKKKADAKKKAAAKKKADAKKKAAAKKKADAKRRADAAAAAKRQAARIEGEAGTAMGMATGAIQSAVTSSWIQPQTSTIGLQVTIRVNVRPGGVVTSARVVRSSGNALFDRSAEIAILKASPLPIPSDPRYYQYIKEFDFRFSPNG